MNHSAIICYILGCSVSTLVVFLMCMDFVMFIVDFLIIVIHYFFFVTEISWLGQEWRGWRLSGVPCPYGSVRVASLKLYTLREEIVTANTRQQWVVILSVPTRLALLAAQPREEELPAIVATVKHETQ